MDELWQTSPFSFLSFCKIATDVNENYFLPFITMHNIENRFTHHWKGIQALERIIINIESISPVVLLN